MIDINWRLFTDEEKANITHLVNSGNWRGIVSVIETITPEKEKELQILISDLQPKTVGFESEVRKKYEGFDIKTPEQEAMIQRELEHEYQEWLNKQEMPAEETKEETVEEVNEIAEEIPSETLEETLPESQEETTEEPLQATF